jgi:rod shape-determining protein MreC
MNIRRPRSLNTIIVILIVIGVMTLALGGYLSPLSRVLLNPLVGVQTWVFERYTAISAFINAPRDVAELQAQNEQLQREIARLQTQIIELQQQNTDLQVLSALLDFARANPTNDYLAASVIGRDPSPFLYYVIINRGSDDGLRRGMPVVSAQGLIGRVAAVTAGAARVQLISDPEAVVNVRLQNSGEEALLEGSITGDIFIGMIPQETTVQTGDLVLTSGLGGSYPSNLLIGQVSSVRSRSFDLFQRASVQPVADFTQLDIVLVIQNFRPVDATPLIP